VGVTPPPLGDSELAAFKPGGVGRAAVNRPQPPLAARPSSPGRDRSSGGTGKECGLGVRCRSATVARRVTTRASREYPQVDRASPAGSHHMRLRQVLLESTCLGCFLHSRHYHQAMDSPPYRYRSLWKCHNYCQCHFAKRSFSSDGRLKRRNKLPAPRYKKSHR
jgi:hypothetical protein